MKYPQTIRVATLAVILLASTIAIAGGSVLRWAFADANVLVIKNAPVPVVPTEVQDGGSISLFVDFCKKGDVKGKTTLNLVKETPGPKIAISWPDDGLEDTCSTDLTVRVACDENDTGRNCAKVDIPIPAQTPTDTYHAEFITCYDINPLKKPCITFRSKDFKVINSVLKPGDAKAEN